MGISVWRQTEGAYGFGVAYFWPSLYFYFWRWTLSFDFASVTND